MSSVGGGHRGGGGGGANTNNDNDTFNWLKSTRAQVDLPGRLESATSGVPLGSLRKPFNAP